MKQGFYQVLAFIPLIIMLFGVLSGISRFARLGHIQYLILILISCAFLADSVSFVLMKNEITTFPVFHVYAPVEYTLLMLVFAQFHKATRLQKIFKSSIIAIWVFALLNVVLWQDFESSNTNVTILSSLVLILASIVSFFQILNQTIYTRIERSSFFWVIVGVMIFFSSSFLLFTYSNWLKPIDVATAINVWFLHIFFNTIHYLCFNIALWMDPE